MIEIIYSSSIKEILKFDMRGKANCSFINVNNEMKEYSEILINKGVKEIKLEQISDDEIKLCEKEYISNIAELSSCFSSLEWWANPVSEKNEHVSSHYKNLCLYYSLIKTLEKHMDTISCIFVVCSDEISEQLRAYCNKNNITIVPVRPAIILWLNKMFKELYLLLRAIFFLLKVAIRKLRIPRALRLRIKRAIDIGKDYYVIRTWLDDRFLKTNGLYSDAYFGRLPAYVVDRGYKLLMLAGIINNYTKVVKKIEDNGDVMIAPEEYFFRYADFFRLLSFLFSGRKRLGQEVLFNGLDVTVLYEREMANGCFSVVDMTNMFRYFVARGFAEAVSFRIYIQTYENYAWEKMAILGIREVKPQGKILGFQHAFISRNSFKYFPGEKERDIIPLPDKIITMGKRTKKIMEKYGNYSQEMLKIGCALRQEYLNDFNLLKRKRFDKIVVPLTMVSNESVLVLKFLYESGLGNTKMKVIIRCHPAAPFKSFKNHINFQLPDNFIISNEESVNEELSTTDIVLYTWTTVAVEALRLGLPIIYLDVLNPMYVDPLFECNALKNSVKKPKELLSAINDFYNMDDKSFYMEQQVAQEYLKEYFYPVTEENLAPFLTN